MADHGKSGNSGKTVRIRVLCDDQRHAGKTVVVASYKRNILSVPGEPLWTWEEYKAWGATGVNDQHTGEPEIKGSWRPATEEELAGGSPFRVELPHRRAVRQHDRTFDRLACPTCDLELVLNREEWDVRLTQLSDAGVNKVTLPALVAWATRR